MKVINYEEFKRLLLEERKKIPSTAPGYAWQHVKHGIKIALRCLERCQDISTDLLFMAQPQWISCTERLPDAYDKEPEWSKTVLFRTAEGHIHSGYRHIGRPQTSFYDDDWSSPYWLGESERLEFEEESVTHWMPLPEPPKGDE